MGGVIGLDHMAIRADLADYPDLNASAVMCIIRYIEAGYVPALHKKSDSTEDMANG